MTDEWLYAAELPAETDDWASTYQPETEMEALMQAGPGEPVQSAVEQSRLAEAIASCYRYLLPSHRLVLDLTQVQGLTLEEAANELGMSRMGVSRLRDAAADEMRAILRCNPVVAAQLDDDDGGFEWACRLACWEVLNVELVAPSGWVAEDWGDVANTAMHYAIQARVQLRELTFAEIGPHQVSAILADKHRAYGTQNILTFGPLGVLVRLSDKLSRRDNLYKGNLESVANESLVDTLVDIIGYAVLAVMNRDGTYTRELTGQ